MGVMLGDVRCLTADATKNPYGLIEGTVRRDGAPAAELAFDPGQGW